MARDEQTKTPFRATLETCSPLSQRGNLAMDTLHLTRRKWVVGFGLALVATAACIAEPSASDFISGRIVKIDHEAGKITLQHDAIPYLHLRAGTTTFRFVEAKWLIGRRDGDRVRFQADRFDLSLRKTALIYVPT